MPFSRFGQFPFAARVALLQTHALQQAARSHDGFVEPLLSCSHIGNKKFQIHAKFFTKTPGFLDLHSPVTDLLA